jgi:excisionase family DNA binding protein
MFEQIKDVVNIEELCKMLSIGKNTAYQLKNTGEIKSFKIGKVHKIPKKSGIAYINGNIDRECTGIYTEF